MRNLYILLLFSFFGNCALNAQCEKEISTNPDHPVNNEFLPLKNTWYSDYAPYSENSYLNTSINWKVGSHILLDLKPGWINPLFPAFNPPYSTQEFFNMRSPFSTSHSASHLNPNFLDELYRDFHWEDGWELLWSNLGKFPNGDPVNNSSTGTFFEKNNSIANPKVFYPSPDHVPYFALYNRYNGMIRLFSNVWFDPLGSYYDDVLITFRSNPDDLGISGLFRTIGNYDEALDQPTKYYKMYATRNDPKASRDWNISEFQVGFDPCICLTQRILPGDIDPNDPNDNREPNNGPGSLLFEFETFTNLDVNIVSRSSSVDVKQNDYNNGIMPFLTLNNYNTGNFAPGYEIHRMTTQLFDDYRAKLQDYNTKLNDYNNPWNKAKRDFINLGKTFVTSSATLILPTNFPSDFIKTFSLNSRDDGKTADKIVSDGLKGLIGIGYDLAAFEIFGNQPEKPVKPNSPVVNFSEGLMRGNIVGSNLISTPQLFVPGAVTDNNYGYGGSRILGPNNFPAYNKVLGQVALLESPKIDYFFDEDLDEVNDWNIYGLRSNLFLKFHDLKIALNNLLDFDFNLTNTFINIEVEFTTISLNTVPGNKYPPLYMFSD